MFVAAVSCLLVFGATVPAATCSRADVEAALLAASAGDEVLIPAGTCAWTTQLTLDKRVTLRGAGTALTTIQDDVSKMSPGAAPLILISTSGVRLTQFTVQGLAPDPGTSLGHLHVYDVRDWRIDHVAFRTPKTSSITAGGVGLIDHCSFLYDYTGGVQVRAFVWDGGTYGDSSWASPSTLGTKQAVFIEDCDFTNQAMLLGSAIETEFGGRAVVRHNVITRDAINQVGTDTAQRLRAGRQLEVYDNTFTAEPFSQAAVTFGGGTGVVFNNSIEADYTQDVRLELIRSVGSYVPWGQCDGTSVYDGNAEAIGYPCLDMVGRGPGDLLTGSPPLPAQWPNQVLEPLAVWNNQPDGGTRVANAASSWIREGRDYVRLAPSGYTPFPYPHPDNVADVDGGVGLDGGAPDTDAGVHPRLSLAVGCGCTNTAGLPWLWLLPLWVAARRRVRS